jgi:hypothetical protein
MTDDLTPPPIPGTPEANDLVVRGADGDPIAHPGGTRMIERESYERVIEGLKISADACMHLAKEERQHGETWRAIGQTLDRVRLAAVSLAGIGFTMQQRETQMVTGAPLTWRKSRDRFLEGLRQATGGMRQLATCFRGDFQWSIMAQDLERRQEQFRALLYGRKPRRAIPGLILPEHLTRQ